MSHACNCGCNLNQEANENLLQIIPRDEASSLNTQTELKVSGMTCAHCVASVTEELNEVDNITNVEVILDAKGTSTVNVTSQGALDEAAVREAIDEAGYTLEAINA